MSVDLNWNLATAQPNMLQLAQQGFETGRAQKMQRVQDEALAKIGANPNDTQAINALLPVNPGLYGQLAGAQQQRQQAERQATRQQAIGGALSQLDGLPEPVRMLAQSDPEGAMQLWEMTGKMDAQQATAAKVNAEKLAAVVTGLQQLPPQQRFAEAQRLAPQFGIDSAQITPETMSDAGIQAILTQAMGVKGVLDLRLREREFEATQGYRQQTLGVQMRGQDMADARARATAARGGGMGNAPSGYRYTATGALEAIPGGPADGSKLTEGQAKSVGYYRQAAAAARTMNSVKDYNPSLVANALYNTDIGYTQLGQSERRILNSQLAFANGVLRLETGATINDGEIRNKARQLFPLPEDGPDVIADKAAQRSEALASMRAAAGAGVRNVPLVKASAPKPPADKRVAGGTLTAPVNGVREWRP